MTRTAIHHRSQGRGGPFGRAAGPGLLITGACFVSCFVLACATEPTVVVWEKPGASPQDIEAAKSACAKEMATVETRGINRERLEAEAAGSRFVDCMRARGFTWRSKKASSGGGRESEEDDSDS